MSLILIGGSKISFFGNKVNKKKSSAVHMARLKLIFNRQWSFTWTEMEVKVLAAAKLSMLAMNPANNWCKIRMCWKDRHLKAERGLRF